jgi:hypothetical protein
MNNLKLKTSLVLSFYLSQMFGPLCQPFPLDHELLGQDGNVKAELITQQIDQTLLRQDQRNVVDRRAIVNVDHLNIDLKSKIQ